MESIELSRLFVFVDQRKRNKKEREREESAKVGRTRACSCPMRPSPSPTRLVLLPRLDWITGTAIPLPHSDKMALLPYIPHAYAKIREKKNECSNESRL